MIKVINDRYELLDFKKSNVYDFTNYEVIIITFDFNTRCIVKANKILCCKLTASAITCNSISSLDDIITKAGNLASDQGMIGRLQAQKDYKAFRAW